MKQRGAAILLAMLVVTLVATLAAGLQWRQWRTYQLEAAARTQSQAAWVLVGALDWARLILREDARSNQNNPVDHLGEPWALPLQEAKLSSFLSADALNDTGQDEAYLSGQITDAQSKINLTNLTNLTNLNNQSTDTPAPHAPTYAALYRLYQYLQLPPQELVQWTTQWLRSESIQPQTIAQLQWLGVPNASITALTPYLTILKLRTPVNLNTAPAAVIYAVIPDITLGQAQQLVTARASAPFQTTTDVQKILALTTTLDTAEYSVFSQHFEVLGRLRLGDWTIDETSLVQRNGAEVKTLWRKRH